MACNYFSGLCTDQFWGEQFARSSIPQSLMSYFEVLFVMFYQVFRLNKHLYLGGRAYSNAYFGAGSGPIVLDDVQCSSSASQLLECYSRPILSHNCLHSDDAGVRCEGVLYNWFPNLLYKPIFINCSFIAPCTTGQLRLAGGNIPNEGRVEICLENLWGTVCTHSWGRMDAAVVCQQLGYSTQGAYQTQVFNNTFTIFFLFLY